MATLKETSSTMINAAFLQEVKDSNVELWHALHDLRQLIDEPGESFPAARQLVSLLSQLRDLLALEFSLEEAYGFITNCRGVEKATAERSEVARQQHRELYLRIQELCERAEESQYRGTAQRELAELLGMAAEFDEYLQAHEDLEAELIGTAFGERPERSVNALKAKRSV